MTAPVRRVTPGPYQPDLEDGFCEAVAALRERDRLASIYVLVPTHILGRHLMRTVARRHGICFNVRFHTFPDLAEIIGIEKLVATRRIPLPPLADLLIARKAVSTAVPPDGYFAPIRDFPSTPRTLLASLTDLKKAGITPDALDQFARAQSSPKLAEVAATYRETERLRIEAGYFDESERLTIATEAAKSSALLDAALAVCLYGFAELKAVAAADWIRTTLKAMTARTILSDRRSFSRAGTSGWPKTTIDPVSGCSTPRCWGPLSVRTRRESRRRISAWPSSAWPGTSSRRLSRASRFSPPPMSPRANAEDLSDKLLRKPLAVGGWLHLTHPTEEYYLRELARRTGQSLRAVQHELPKLERLELARVSRRGRQKFYRANEQHPLFPELKRIVYKTAGLGDVLKDAIAAIEGIDAAFIYGSVAKGGERGGSDVDLMVIGDPDPDRLHRAVRQAEEQLGREVSLATMSTEEWRTRLTSGDAFVVDLLRTNKIFLTGDERDLRRS